MHTFMVTFCFHIESYRIIEKYCCELKKKKIENIKKMIIKFSFRKINRKSNGNLAEITTCDKNHEMKLLMEMKFNGTATFDLIAVREVSVKTHGFSHQN